MIFKEYRVLGSSGNNWPRRNWAIKEMLAKTSLIQCVDCATWHDNTKKCPKCFNFLARIKRTFFKEIK